VSCCGDDGRVMNSYNSTPSVEHSNNKHTSKDICPSSVVHTEALGWRQAESSPCFPICFSHCVNMEYRHDHSLVPQLTVAYLFCWSSFWLPIWNINWLST